jgi:oleandomycin transport system ATP-binding protein
VVRAPVADDSALQAVVARLAAAGITVTELALTLPSLDEVFFTLTGRPTETSEAETDDPDKEVAA